MKKCPFCRNRVNPGGTRCPSCFETLTIERISKKHIGGIFYAFYWKFGFLGGCVIIPILTLVVAALVLLYLMKS